MIDICFFFLLICLFMLFFPKVTIASFWPVEVLNPTSPFSAKVGKWVGQIGEGEKWFCETGLKSRLNELRSSVEQ